jgi:hypothetical protein
MFTMHHSLARERMRSAEQDARQARLAAHLVAARRWQRLERLAGAAHAKHERQAELAQSDLHVHEL